VAGIKHNLWNNYGNDGYKKDPKDEMGEGWHQYAQQASVPYCGFCGKQMHITDETTQFEMQNQVHETCYRKRMMGHGY
jgi:hypothetical protein